MSFLDSGNKSDVFVRGAGTVVPWIRVPAAITEF